MPIKAKPLWTNRITKHVLAHTEIEKWFDKALSRQARRPQRDELMKLADNLKVLLNRANNAELKRQKQNLTGKLKDVSPGEVLQEKTDAVIAAVDDYQSFFGDNFPTAAGDVDLDELKHLLRLVLCIRTPQIKMSGRGQPPKPWKDAARGFAAAVRDTLKNTGFKGSVGLKNPSSPPIIITAAAINWAYGDRLKPAGLLTGMRERRRGKPYKSPFTKS